MTSIFVNVIADSGHAVFTVLRVSVATLIAVGGLVWAIIWLRTFSLKMTPVQAAEFRRIPLWIRASWLFTVAYSAYYFIVAMVIGGTPPTHPPRDGKYWLMWNGKSTEVSKEVYHWSELREAVLIGLICFSLFIAYRFLKKPEVAKS